MPALPGATRNGQRTFSQGCSRRDVLWLTALGAGWWLDHVSSRARLKSSQAEAMQWKADAEIYGKLLQRYPPPGIGLPHSLSPH